MTHTTLNWDTIEDKTYACWMGKNVGGTLGGPLEKPFGEVEPFDIDWYPKLQEGGIPNDDLEIQLVSLKALEEVGPTVTAADLAQYWLDHIVYNFDEYGLQKTNLRLGLMPPVSGAYNNWYKHCMGCPIRSEIWACVAPGHPRIAVKYAYEDAILDHAGGESVNGEFFNTALEAAAFVESDKQKLLDIGLSYVQPQSQTALAIRTAIQAHADGLDWKQARLRVLEVTPHYNAQYSPINMAFQVIGWLYGNDFADTLCKTVNCGYDTDCTGATVGSILGLIAGRAGLPAKWTAPLGDTIATNEPRTPGQGFHGLRCLYVQPNPVPEDLHELTQRVVQMAKRVLQHHDIDTSNGITAGELYADSQTMAMYDRNPMRLDYPRRAVSVGVDFGNSPAVAPGQQKRLAVELCNDHPVALSTQCKIIPPAGWNPSDPQVTEVPARGSTTLHFDVDVPNASQLLTINHLQLSVQVQQRPAEGHIPIVLIGANRYRYTKTYPLDGLSDQQLYDSQLKPEKLIGDPLSATGREAQWSEIAALDNTIPLDVIFSQPGVVYVQTFYHLDESKEVCIAPCATCPVKLWVNDQQLPSPEWGYPLLRPQLWTPLPQTRLQKGWNELLIKFVRAEDKPIPKCELMFLNADGQRPGVVDVLRTRLPWD